MRSTGTLICIASAAAFGAMAVFGKLAYDEGATVGTLLAARFALAAALFWALVLAGGEAGAGLRAWRAATSRIALALGAFGYAAPGRLLLRRAGAHRRLAARRCCSTRSRRSSPSPRSSLGRERADARRLAALALASGGLVLVLASAKAGALDPLGAALALGAAVVYSAYILVSQGIAGRIRPRVLSALVCTGAAVHADRRLGAARRPAPGRGHARRLGLAARASPSSPRSPP